MENANQRFSIAKATTTTDLEIVLSNISFHKSEPRQPEYLAAIAPIHGWNSGDPVQLATAEIKSFERYDEGIEAAAAINRTYIEQTGGDEESREAEYCSVEDLVEGEEYQISLPRREPEIIKIKSFHRDRKLVEIVHVSNNHTEAVVTELTHWEKM